MAAERGHAAIVRSLLSRGADVTATTTLGATPLHWAAYHDHPEAVAILLRHGASPAARDAEGETAATLAIARAQSGSHSDVLELLKGLARHDRERRQAELRQRERQPQEQQDGQQVEL
jgi:ankyrin repeat protein